MLSGPKLNKKESATEKWYLANVALIHSFEH